MKKNQLLINAERIESSILFVRGNRVILDRDLARFYGIKTKVLKQSVRRNRRRFPEDFMFELNIEEFNNWRSQFVTFKSDRMGWRHSPMAFTEQGVAMLSSILHSDRAIEINIAIMRAFVKLRRMLETNAQLAQKLMEMERKYDSQFRVVFEAIRQLMAPTGSEPPRRQIGFKVKEKRLKWGKRK